MSKNSRGGLRPTALSSSVLALVALGAISSAGYARAGQDAHPTAEGSSADELVVTAERNKAAAAAPSKGSVTETQPEAIISSQFIKQVVSDTGNYTNVVLIAPSMAGVGSNGPVGETNKTSLRGFQDGQYNITYDGIFFGDTNDPTHHPASYFPASTIGSAVVDRGPGAAGDLGQANYGGALHFFSPDLSSVAAIRQSATYGSFNTRAFVTTLQSGELKQLDDAKVLLNFDARLSDGALSYESGQAYNGLFKASAPVGSNGTLTLFSSYNYTKFYQPDAGPGETWAQVQAYGKDFGLNNNPNDEHYYKYNYQAKRSDFEYIDYKGVFGNGITAENQGYTYFYSNKTLATDDITGLVGAPTNTSHPGDKLLPQTDIGGYSKGNRYRVFGDIVRVNKNWDWGTLKAGGLVETSNTDRHNILLDLTQNDLPDLKYPVGGVKNQSDVKTLELSDWFQYQLFADLELRPMDNLTITPGFKYVHLKRDVNAAMENSGISDSYNNSTFVRGPLVGSDTYQKPLYFLTANYRIQPDWSVYFQYATGFLIPSLSALYVNTISLNQLQPTTTTNYQAGTVYSHGNFTFDADVYKIEVNNLQLPDPTGQFYINQGDGEYYGVEGEGAVALPYGFSLFANGSINKNRVGGSETLNAPQWTAATGAFFHHGPWAASVTYKRVGDFIAYYNGGPFQTGAVTVTTPDGVVLAPNQARKIDGYDTTDASVSYDFGHFRVKLAAFNLFDHRSLTGIVLGSSAPNAAPAANDLYSYQVGRQVQATIEAKF
jgi:iron complex outermembrane receptor protein